MCIAEMDELKVVHFSDTHVDLLYEPGSNYKCSKPICCRSWSDSSMQALLKYLWWVTLCVSKWSTWVFCILRCIFIMWTIWKHKV
jgi:hypothetical protein